MTRTETSGVREGSSNEDPVSASLRRETAFTRARSRFIAAVMLGAGSMQFALAAVMP